MREKSGAARAPSAPNLTRPAPAARALRGAPLWLLVGLTLWASGAAAQRPSVYDNPVVAGDFPDPSVVRVGGDYWATATTGGWAPHFTIMHSRDLVNWRPVGAVFARAPAWAKGDFWAPEINVDRGRFYVYYTARRDEGPGRRGTLCVAVATARRPQGPYTDRGPLVCQEAGSIDAFATRDENDRRYLVWKEDGNDRNRPTPIWAQPLAEDGLRLVGRPREILRNDASWERHVTEGSYILRRGGWFYHFYSGNACCGRDCRYALGVARARRLLGPWEKDPRNPILAANESWQCPGHGSIVETPDGRALMLYHSYRRRAGGFNVGREALLDEIVWGADGWPSINGGRGPSAAGPSPLGITESPDEAEVFDDFDGARLDAAWQWPMRNEQSARVEAGPRGGRLLLSAIGARGDEWTGAVLARRATSGDYVATTLVDAAGLGRGARAGLSAFSWRDAAVGVAAGRGKLYVWRREGRKQEVLTSTDAPRAASIYLRMEAAGGETYRFAYSTDGRDWAELGGPVGGGHIEGARVALTAGGSAGAVARFDWLRVRPAAASAGGDRPAGR